MEISDFLGYKKLSEMFSLRNHKPETTEDSEEDYKTNLLQEKLGRAHFNVDYENRRLEEAVAERDIAMKEVVQYSKWLDEIKAAKTVEKRVK